MHPVILQQLVAEHVQEMIAEADDARRARQAGRARRGPSTQLRRSGRPGIHRESERVTAAIAADPRLSCPPAGRSLVRQGPKDRAAGDVAGCRP
jgi:hypothetical protein